jgi:HSP20 family protein
VNYKENIMATQDKQQVSVETKAPQADKPAPNMWMRPYEEFERFFERMLGRNWPKPFKWETPAAWGELMGSPESRLPSIDIIDHDDHLLVKAEIPGVNKDDLNVSISDNVLTIKGDTRHEEKKKDGDYFRHEISSTSFARSVTLPVAVDASKISAALTDGMLEVTVGKAETSKRRSVKVQ